MLEFGFWGICLSFWLSGVTLSFLAGLLWFIRESCVLHLTDWLIDWLKLVPIHCWCSKQVWSSYCHYFVKPVACSVMDSVIEEVTQTLLFSSCYTEQTNIWEVFWLQFIMPDLNEMLIKSCEWFVQSRRVSYSNCHVKPEHQWFLVFQKNLVYFICHWHFAVSTHSDYMPLRH